MSDIKGIYLLLLYLPPYTPPARALRLTVDLDGTKRYWHYIQKFVKQQNSKTHSRKHNHKKTGLNILFGNIQSCFFRISTKYYSK